MPRVKGNLSEAQKAALAAGRERRAQEAAAKRTRAKPLETAEDFIEAEGLDQPVDRPAHKPARKARPESLITPEAILASAAIANRVAVALGGSEAAMTPDEAAGFTAPLLRIGARAGAKLLEKLFPAGLNNIEDGNLRDLSASATSLAKYALRQTGRVLWQLEKLRMERQQKGNGRGPDTSMPPRPPTVTYNAPAPPDDYDDSPAPAMPDTAAQARNGGNGVLAGGMAALAGIIPTDTGQGML